MARQKEPQDRQLLKLGVLDGLIAEDHYIRLLAAFVERAVAGNEEYYTNKGLGPTGQRPYGAVTMLLLHLYGYLNRVSSSRRLEMEAGRNIELIWLLGGLQPDFKTIADYRKDQGVQIRQLLKQFNQFLQDHAYIEGRQVSVDGMRTKANASRTCYSLKKIEGRLKKLDAQLDRYWQEVGVRDQIETLEEELDELDEQKQAAIDRIASLQQEVEDLLKKKEVLANDPRQQINFTDEQASLLRTRDGWMPAYNNQAVVCDKHKLLMLWEVTDTMNDRRNLSPILQQVEQQYATRPQLARADSDYFNISDIQALEKNGTNVYCNVPRTVNPLPAEDEQGQAIVFTYDEQADRYTCSEGRVLAFSRKENKGNRQARRYRGTHCQDCPLRQKCIRGKGRQRNLYRYEDEPWKERYIKKMNSPTGKAHSARRRAFVEHPFGTVKTTLMDRLQLKLRGSYKVQTEICLYHFAYNFKRLLNLDSFEYLMGLVAKYDFKISKTVPQNQQKGE